MKLRVTLAALVAAVLVPPLPALAQDAGGNDDPPLAAGASAAEAYAREVNARRVRALRTLTLISAAENGALQPGRTAAGDVHQEVLCEFQAQRFHGLDAARAARLIGEGVGAFAPQTSTTLIGAAGSAFGAMPQPALELEGDPVTRQVGALCAYDLGQAGQTRFGRSGGVESGLIEATLALIGVVNKLKPAAIRALDFGANIRRERALRRWVTENGAEIDAVAARLNELAGESIAADAPVRRVAAYEYLTAFEAFGVDMRAREPAETAPDYRVVDAGGAGLYARPGTQDGSLVAVLDAAEAYDAALDSSLTGGEAYGTLATALTKLKTDAASGASMAGALASFEQALQILSDLSEAAEDEELEAAIAALNEALED